MGILADSNFITHWQCRGEVKSIGNGSRGQVTAARRSGSVTLFLSGFDKLPIVNEAGTISVMYDPC
jgi:hypothetical protein